MVADSAARRLSKSPFRWQNYQAFHAEVDAEEAAFAGFGADAAGNEKLIHVGAAKGDVTGRDVAAVILANQLAAGIEDLDLLHAVVGDVEIAGRVQAHPIRLILEQRATLLYR